MSDDKFQELSRRMFTLYHEQDYSKAYEEITREVEDFPEWAGRMHFWRICLATRMGEIDLAPIIRLLPEKVGVIVDGLMTVLDIVYEPDLRGMLLNQSNSH